MAKYSDEAIRVALRGRQAVQRYPFPGKPDLEVGLKLLSDAELDGVRLEAVELCKRAKAELLADPEFLDRMIHRETVSRAYVDIDQPDEPFFSSQREVAELDNLTVRSLFELYKAHHEAMDPFLYASPEEVGSLVESLKKSSQPLAVLSLYDLSTLRHCVISMVSMQRVTPPSPS